jgi:iron(III) transport system permease protein
MGMRILRWLGRWAGTGLWVAALAPAFALVPAAVLDRGAGGTVRPTLFPLALAALDPFLWDCARNSVTVALCVSLGSLVLGIGLARIVVRWRFWGRPVLAALTLAPVVVPPLFGAIGLRRLAGLLLGSGWPTLGALAGWFGWGWVALVSGVPLVALATAAALTRVNPACEDAARLAGSTDRRTWWRLIWPAVRPGAARAAGVVFTLTLIEPGGPLVLGLRRTLSFQIVDAALGPEPSPRAAVLAVFATVLAVVARGLFGWWGRGDRGRAAGLDLADQAIARAAIARWPRAAGYTALLGLAAALGWAPIVALLATALSSGLSMRGIGDVDPESQRLLLNSLMLGLAVVAIDLALGSTLACWAGRRSFWVLSLAAWPELFPPLALGVGALVLPELLHMGADWARVSSGAGHEALARGAGLLAGTLDTYRTPGVMLALAVAAARLPLQARAIEHGWRQFRPTLIDAALLVGARPRQARRTATGLWLGTAPSVLFLTFTLAATNLAPALLLAPTIETRPLAPAILILVDEPGDALARACTLAAVAVTVNLTALTFAATRRSMHLGDWFRG